MFRNFKLESNLWLRLVSKPMLKFSFPHPQTIWSLCDACNTFLLVPILHSGISFEVQLAISCQVLTPTTLCCILHWTLLLFHSLILSSWLIFSSTGHALLLVSHLFWVSWRANRCLHVPSLHVDHNKNWMQALFKGVLRHLIAWKLQNRFQIRLQW